MAEKIGWNDENLQHITSLELEECLLENIWIVKNCRGVTRDGNLCQVQVPFTRLPRSRSRRAMWAVMYAHGNRDQVRVNKILDKHAIQIQEQGEIYERTKMRA